MRKHIWPILAVVSSMLLSVALVWAVSDAVCVYKDGLYSFCSRKNSLSSTDAVNAFQRGMP